MTNKPGSHRGGRKSENKPPIIIKNSATRSSTRLSSNCKNSTAATPKKTAPSSELLQPKPDLMKKQHPETAAGPSGIDGATEVPPEEISQELTYTPTREPALEEPAHDEQLITPVVETSQNETSTAETGDPSNPTEDTDKDSSDAKHEEQLTNELAPEPAAGSETTSEKIPSPTKVSPSQSVLVTEAHAESEAEVKQTDVESPESEHEHVVDEHVVDEAVVDVGSPADLTPAKEEVDKENCPCGASTGGKDWKIRCTVCDQYWHQSCLTLDGLDSKAIGKLTKFQCPLCYHSPIERTPDVIKHLDLTTCFTCKNEQNLREATLNFQSMVTTRHLRAVTKQFESLNLEELKQNLHKLKTYDLQMTHLLLQEPQLKHRTEVVKKLTSEIGGLSKQLSSTREELLNLATHPVDDKIAQLSLKLDETSAKFAACLEEFGNERSQQAKPHSDSITSSRITPTSRVPHTETCFSSISPNFITEEEAKALRIFLVSQEFHQEGGRHTLTLGEDYRYNGSKSHQALPVSEELKPLFSQINDLQKKLHREKFPDSETYGRPAPEINSCLVNWFPGESRLPPHSDAEMVIHPESSIFTVSIGSPCDVRFTNKQDDSHVEDLKVEPKSLYVMTRKSQEYFRHQIDEIPDARYSLTFRSCSTNNANSTCLMGDSNSDRAYFGKGEGTFGAEMPGQRFWAPNIHSLNPAWCAGYSNAVVMVGTNCLKKSSVSCKEDVHRLGEKLLDKLKRMKQVNPRIKIFLCPVLPSRDEQLNLKILDFIAYIKQTLIPNNNYVIYVEGFNDFVDEFRFFLADKFSRQRNKHGAPDVLHLNHDGKRRLARLIKRSIFSRTDKKQGSQANYSSSRRATPGALMPSSVGFQNQV